MLNCSLELDWDKRLSIIEDFIQILVNSGHKYPFVKAIILQGITKYRSMVGRSLLCETDEKYMPLYRARSFRQTTRKLCKLVEGMTWYKGLNYYDQYRNEWKAKLNKKKNNLNKTTSD